MLKLCQRYAKNLFLTVRIRLWKKRRMVIMTKKARKIRRTRGVWNKIFIGIVFVGLSFCIYKSYVIVMANEIKQPNIQEEQTMLSDDFRADWNLILVNRENYIPTDYQLELTELSNGKSVDTRVYPSLQQMFDDARKEGVYPIVREGYRTQQEQERLMQEKIRAFELEGYSQQKAKELAKEWVAIPGTSEHQLGIAIDINADSEKSTNEAVFEWLATNAHKYGFILRYPENKVEITGIQFEPWHYRYVGENAAKEIHSRGVCLEEYLSQ